MTLVKIPELYKNHENDDLYILEFPDGSKKSLTHDALKKLNEESFVTESTLSGKSALNLTDSAKKAARADLWPVAAT